MTDTEYTPSLDEEEAFIASSFIDFHTQQPAGGEWIPMMEAEARDRWESWLAAHDEAVRQEERERCAQIAEVWDTGRGRVAARIRGQVR